MAGKTVSRRLNQAEAELYQGWIANRRRLEQIIAQMEEISATAGELLLLLPPADTSNHPEQRNADSHRWGPNSHREVRNVS